MGSLKPLSQVLRGCSLSELEPGRPVLELRDVELSFGGVQALRGVSFEMGRDELLAIIGPNGAGKTSLLNCISGFYRPQGGAIELLGSPAALGAPVEIARRGVARMFQNVELFESLTVLDNLMLGRHTHVRYGALAAMAWVGRARREEIAHREVVEEIIEFLQIEAHRKAPVSALSLGIKKRVELGRALACEPKLLALDEPVAGMNLEETEDMARFIVDIRRELGIPMVLVEHDMGVVMDLADRVLVLDFGAPVAIGTPAQVQRHPDVIRAYLGQEHAEAGAARDGSAAGASAA